MTEPQPIDAAEPLGYTETPPTTVEDARALVRTGVAAGLYRRDEGTWFVLGSPLPVWSADTMALTSLLDDGEIVVSASGAVSLVTIVRDDYLEGDGDALTALALDGGPIGIDVGD